MTWNRTRRRWCWLHHMVIAATLLVTGSAVGHAADSPHLSQEEFQLVWERTEAPIANGDTERSWLWGPEPRTETLRERYLDSPGQERTVQYFDKGRMEVNQPDADPSDPWFVTSGLLTRELITGDIQMGDDDFLNTGQGARVQIAGDHMSPFPQYHHLADVIDQGSPDRTGERADTILTPEGAVRDGQHPDDPNAEFVHHITYRGPDNVDVGYNIPSAFWEYLNAPGVVYDSDGELETIEPLFSWIYVMGFPIADPFWAEVSVGGEPTWVLVQPFERRVLTYTPSNANEWQVEMGNIGQHYRDWRSQYLQPAREGGEPEFFGLYEEAYWRYDTPEYWEAAGTTESFTGGSTTWARTEIKPGGTRMTHWSAGEDGLYFHGWDRLDDRGTILDMVVYSPPIHVLPDERVRGEVLSTEAVAISMNEEPEYATIEATVGVRQLVSTSAGGFWTWRIEGVSDFENPNFKHLLGDAYHFEPQIGMIYWVNSQGGSGWLIDSSTIEKFP